MPVAATVPPGECQFGDEWTTVPLISKEVLTHDTRMFTFATPDPSKALGLSTCACILARGRAIGDVDAPVKPYTPVSTNELQGAFQMMVKIYPSDTGMSSQMDALSVGQTVDFKHIAPNVKLQYPFKASRITMLVGGTGIAPMLQALHPILATAGDKTKVDVVYGSRTSNDILAHETLDAWSAAHGDQLTVTHILSDEPKDSAWGGARGFMNKDFLLTCTSPPTDDNLVLVCGPPPMYNALCGARDQKDITGVLNDIGFDSDHVVKF